MLILTAADSVEQRVKGLDLGADDYMAKPFSLQELEARVRALTRRGLGSAATIIKHGPLIFDATGRVAYINDQMIELSARELWLLEVLLQRAGRLVSKDQLVERLCEWGEEVSNNAIEVYIHRLRKKIEQGPIRIATVRGLGYCLEKIAGLTAAARQRGVRAERPAHAPRRSSSQPMRYRRCAAKRAALAVRRDPRLDARAAAAAVADELCLTWLVAQNIADKPFDRELGKVVRAIAQQVSVQPAGGDGCPGAACACPPGRRAAARRRRRPRLLPGAGRARRVPRRRRRPAGAGRRARRHDRRGALPRRDHARRARCAWPTSGWRCRRRGRRQRPALVQVAETLEKRSRLATEIIKGVILPQFVILPLAVLLVWLALARGIKPLNAAAAAHPRAKATDLSPLDERDVPDEVAPLVRAINDLLARLDQSIAHAEALPGRRRAPAEDAAGRPAHAGRAGRSARSTPAPAMPASLKKSLQQIALFQPARGAHGQPAAGHGARRRPASRRCASRTVDLARHRHARRCATSCPRAMEKRIDLGYEGPEPARAGVRLDGNPALLREMVRNLVDNALHYTPAGGTVTARVVADPFGQVVVLQVEDSGPGIAEAERELVFQPFYRALGTNVDGSGLGLAIVREIAEQHGAEISVADAQAASVAAATGTGPGTLITVRFPVRARRGGRLSVQPCAVAPASATARVVLAGQPVGAGLRKQRRRRLAEPRPQPGAGGHVQGQARILGQQRHLGMHRRVAGQRAAQPVAADPALPARLLDHRQRGRRVQPSRCASASASAAPARLMAASRLLTSLVRAPSPGRVPIRNSRFDRSPSSALPALEDGVGAGHHQAHRAVAGAQPGRPTSARRACRCRARPGRRRCFDRRGAIVGHSSTVAPGARPCTAPRVAEQHLFASAAHRPRRRSAARGPAPARRHRQTRWRRAACARARAPRRGRARPRA